MGPRAAAAFDAVPPGAGRPAVVLLSGGLDSATVLAVAVRRGFAVHGLAVDYGQRHRTELAAAAEMAGALGAASMRTVAVDLRAVGGSALTDDAMAVPQSAVGSDAATAPGGPGIPVTYVPARNLTFLSIAAGLAETLDADHVLCGVNAVDYSGYPDCRRQFIDAFERTATLATRAGDEGRTLSVLTPLIDLRKADIVRLGTALGVDHARTRSCYAPDDRGRACGRCDSCHLRAQGFRDAGLPDPTEYQPGAAP